MPSLEESFEFAAQMVQQYSQILNLKTSLRFRALYNQAKLGDASGPRPSIFSPIDRAMYDAWTKVRGMSKVDSMREFVKLASETFEKAANS
jgi:diazepam-binding inhibitor (GABA receptor modulator, acyl-CoA-binding protein)